MLRPWANNKTLGTAKKNPRPHAYGQIIGIIQKWAQLSGRGVVGVARPGFEDTHVGIDGLIGQINGAIVVLIGISGIQQHSVWQIREGDLFIDLPVRVAVGSVSSRPQPHLFASYEIMDHMAPTILELAGVNAVEWIILCRFCRPEIDINSSQSCIGRYAVQPDFGRFDGGFRVAKVDEGPG